MNQVQERNRLLDIFNAHHPSTIEKPILRYISEKVDLGGIVLDVGSGYGLFGYLIKLLEPHVVTVAIDVKEGFLRRIRDADSYSHYVKATAERLPIRSVIHLSLMTEVIEHLGKEDGLNAIKDLKRISEHVIITTPENGRIIGNHLSSYVAQDFDRQGFKTIKIPYHDIPRSLIPLYKVRCFLFKCGTGNVLISTYCVEES